jgi:hypothetical protein
METLTITPEIWRLRKAHGDRNRSGISGIYLHGAERSRSKGR